MKKEPLKVYTNTKRVISRKLLRTLQPCQAMVPLMSESLDRKLGLLERLNLKLHLLVCAWCARYLKQIKFLRRLVQQEPLASVTFDRSTDVLTPAARQRIFESLRR